MVSKAALAVALLAASFIGAKAQIVFPGFSIQQQTTPQQQRAQVRPFIIAMTNCVAQRVLEDPAGAQAFKDDTLDTFAPSIMDRCPRALAQLTQAYEQVYGPGRAEAFINGPYAKDLSRAVLTRIKPQLVEKVEAMARQEEAQAAQAAREKAEAETRYREAEAERQRQAAEAEQRTAAARAEAEKAQAQERAAAQVAEAERLKQVAIATGAAKLLATKTLECGREQLKSLVKSGESAEVLASAVMTMCGSEVEHFVDAGIKEYNLEHELKDDDAADGLVREKMKAETREHIVALAVQAKAGVGGFAPASSN